MVFFLAYKRKVDVELGIVIASRKTDMYCHTLIILAFAIMTTAAWSAPFFPVHRAPAPIRITRYAPYPPPHRIPIPVREEDPERPRPKRDHDDYDDQREKDSSGVIGPVHTFVKTDKNANYKWGVRHHVGNKYA